MFRLPSAVLLLIGSVIFLIPDIGLAFGPCQWRMPPDVSYVPTLDVCNGKAAVVVTGAYYNSFSIVARDCANGDRDPCHRHFGSCGTNYSSPFKVQKIVNAWVKRTKSEKLMKANIHCLKEAGTSLIYRLMVRRITIKLRNPVRKPSDIVKLCIGNSKAMINPVAVSRVISARGLDNFGWAPVCRTQGYLDCPYHKSSLCKGR